MLPSEAKECTNHLVVNLYTCIFQRYATQHTTDVQDHQLGWSQKNFTRVFGPQRRRTQCLAPCGIVEMPSCALYVLPIWILQGIEVMKEDHACKQRVLRCISTKLLFLLLERVRSTTTDIKGWKFYVNLIGNWGPSY